MSQSNVDPRKLSLSTRAIHGNKLYAFKGPVSLPIYQTTNYRFENSGDAIRYAQGDSSVFVYSRYHNPTVQDVEEKLALMEGAEAATLFASGMAAISTAIFAVTSAGEEIVSTPGLYGGTYRFFRDELPKTGITVRYADPDLPESVESLISEKTRIVYLETPTNPTLGIIDIEALVKHVRKAERRTGRKLLVMIDNTFATILNQNPFSFGADAIVESATKYLGGHSDVMAGVVLGTREYISAVKTAARYYGGCADPFAAYLLFRSLKTFELRVGKQNENAFTMATALESHPAVSRVIYPGLPSHPAHKLAAKQMSGYGGMITLEVRNTKSSSPEQAAIAVCDHLRIAVNAMSLGGVETLVSIPVLSSHVHMSDEELKKHGVTRGMLRISVGVEGVEDLLEDFRQALDFA